MQSSSLNKLLAQCHSGDPVQQVEALHSLLNREAYASVPTILELLVSPDDVVRSTATRVLGQLGTQERELVGSALINLLTDAEVIVRSEAVDTLGILGYTLATEAIKSLLKNDPEPIVRASAAESLGDLGNVNALEELESALLDPDESVRAYAASSIGLLGTPQLLPKLQTYIESETSSGVKAQLFGARARLGALEDFKLLLNLLDTSDEDLAIMILNLFTDLMERKVPSAITANISTMREVLLRISQRFPILHSHVEILIAQLIKIDTF
ncbi:HEAT repeat domain-containing protein [Nostoc sp. LPT]|uniref:HEAT repeat domain-containing protein n=1 Tax=Nostoc sp. LPT TaxID=2815387 RepID=UPI001D659EA2|nr:HEAT repeat domain-containing protein [Nostoc sp. LPT]MBN4004572.1 HEAT repeat domain-containing protein [Nostoc sp. LPT]